jgi:hypothetical protein
MKEALFVHFLNVFISSLKYRLGVGEYQVWKEKRAKAVFRDKKLVCAELFLVLGSFVLITEFLTQLKNS